MIQTKERTHPYEDGQGRVDTIELQKLLTENGFTPTITDPLFASSTTTLEEWIVILKEGMKRWCGEAGISAPFSD